MALAVTLIVVVLGRQVDYFAHQQSATRQNETLNFGALATALLGQENSFDARLASLLTTGTSLSRSAFVTDVSAMEQELSLWRSEATQLESPGLSPALNVTLAHETLARVADYENVLFAVGQALAINIPAPQPVLRLGVAQLSLAATAASWGQERHELASQPGSLTLMALSAKSSRLNVPGYLQTLAASAALAPTRAFVISAVQVQPAPLPAAVGSLDLTPTTAMQVQVAATNERDITQAVVETLSFVPAGGSGQHVTQSVTLAPLASYAFDPHSFAVHPGEKGTLTVTLSPAPGVGGLTHQRVYAVSVAPAPVVG